MTELVVGPFNRVEGDLEVHLTVRDGRVAEARVNSPLYRGFARMLDGKDPRDAPTITPPITSPISTCSSCRISPGPPIAAAAGMTGQWRASLPWKAPPRVRRSRRGRR